MTATPAPTSFSCVRCGAFARHALRLANVTFRGPYCCACVDNLMIEMDGETVLQHAVQLQLARHAGRCPDRPPTQEANNGR